MGDHLIHLWPAPARGFLVVVGTVGALACGGVQATHDLSEHFVVKTIGWSFRYQEHLEFFVRESDGKLTWIGAARDPEWAAKFPWGMQGLESKAVAISGDGEALVYAHTFGPPAERPYGVYFRRYDEPERLLLPGHIGATNRGKPLPAYVVASGAKGVTTNGEVVELALLESSALHAAALAGDVVRIDSLARTGHDLHALNYWGHEPLELAIAARHEPAALRLIEHGASGGACSALLLYLAATYKLTETVRALLRRGASATAPGPEGFSPTHAAVLLPGAYVSHDVVIGATKPAEYGSIIPEATAILEIILAAGGDPNARSLGGETPLDLVSDAQYWWDQRDHPELRDELRRLLIEAVVARALVPSGSGPRLAWISGRVGQCSTGNSG